MQTKVCVSVAVLCLLASACVSRSPESARTAERRTIHVGLLMSNLENPFFATLVEGAQNAARRSGADVVVRDAHDDVAIQSEQVDRLVADHVDLLVVNPTAPSVAAAVERAVTRGVPVITVDRSLPGVPVVSDISSDNVAGGHTAAVYLADALGGTGDVIEVVAGDGTSADTGRGIGFRQALVSFPRVRVVERLTAGFDRVTARRLFGGALARHPRVRGVFAHNDQMILGVLDALSAMHRTDGLALVGFDGIDEVVDDIDRGLILATVAQQPAEMGRLSIETAVQYLAGKRVEASIAVDLALVTR